MMETPRILLIEDDSEIRSLVSAYLRKNGFLVDTGDGGVNSGAFVARFPAGTVVPAQRLTASGMSQLPEPTSKIRRVLPTCRPTVSVARKR